MYPKKKTLLKIVMLCTLCIHDIHDDSVNHVYSAAGARK